MTLSPNFRTPARFRSCRGGLVLAFVLSFSLVAQSALAMLPDLVDLSEQAGKSVVNISTKTKPKERQTMQRSPRGQQPFGRSPLEDFFHDFFGDRMPQRRPQASLGSGFIISADGFIVTNNHVVRNADEIEVTLQGKDKPYPAKVIGTDPETDLALIKIEPDDELPVLKWGDSEHAKVGQWVVAIGNPFGLDHSVTAGIISAKGRVIGAGPYDNFIQTDASINPGNSGGPLLNLNCEVIGINTAIIASGQGIGFAVPSSTARSVLAQLKDAGEVKRGLLGVRIQDVDEDTAKALGLEAASGALIASVSEDSPAEEAGLKRGDVITKVDGEDVDGSRELTRTIGSMAPGDKVKLTYVRGGKEKTVRITLAQRTPESLAQMGGQHGQAESETVLGMDLRELADPEAKALNLDDGQGVLVEEVEPGSAAEEAGVRPGDVLLEINQQPVANPADVQRVIEQDARKKGAALLLLLRRGQNMFRTIPVE